MRFFVEKGTIKVETTRIQKGEKELWKVKSWVLHKGSDLYVNVGTSFYRSREKMIEQFIKWQKNGWDVVVEYRLN